MEVTSPGSTHGWPCGHLAPVAGFRLHVCKRHVGLGDRSSPFPPCKEPGVPKHKFIYGISTVPFQLFKHDRRQLRRYKENLSQAISKQNKASCGRCLALDTFSNSYPVHLHREQKQPFFFFLNNTPIVFLPGFSLGRVPAMWIRSFRNFYNVTYLCKLAVFIATGTTTAP